MIEQQGSIEALKEKNLKITWNLIGLCNFHCPYCLDMNGKKSIYYQNDEKVKFAVRNLLSLNFNSFEFYLLGGEPTLYPKLKLLTDELLLDSRVKRIYVMTNGSNDIVFPNDDRLKIIVSVHPLSINKLKLKKKENVFFNLLAYPKIFEKVLELYSKLDIDEITVVRRPPDFEDIFEYTDKQKEWIISHDPNRIKPQQLYQSSWIFSDGRIEKQPNYSLMEFNQNKYLNFENMFCLNNSLNIQPNGHYKYTCYNSRLSKYSIFENPIEYKPYIIKCGYHFCNCAGRLNIMKIRNQEKAEKYFKLI